MGTSRWSLDRPCLSPTPRLVWYTSRDMADPSKTTPRHEHS
jgi:hypothetical protein